MRGKSNRCEEGVIVSLSPFLQRLNEELYTLDPVSLKQH